MNPLIRNTVFFIGWLLSPLTFWNDAFINIPLSYLAASMVVKLFGVDFLITVIVFYWISNFIGLSMMYASGKYIVQNTKGMLKELISLIVTITVYTAILMVLGKFGILKPI